MLTESDTEYDLFISYAHADNGSGWLTALVEAIKAEYAKFTSTPLKIFFDQTEIKSMNDWEHNILRAIRESKIMLAALSPAYFQSEYCRKEWELYVEHELALAMPGEAIAPIYIATYDSFEGQAEDALNEWLLNLKRRQYVDVRQWCEEGPLALQRQDVRARLELMDQQIAERLDRLTRVHASPTTVPDHNPHFVGRKDDLRKVRELLALGRKGGATALHGIGGIGKSALAFEYAHAYADDYPGGRFLIGCEGDTGLRDSLQKLVPQLGIELTVAEQRDSEAAAARIKAALGSRSRMLLLMDNVDDPRLLAPQQCSRYLPDGAKVHVLATTRLESDRLPGTQYLSLDPLSETDAVRLLEKHRPFSSDDVDDEWKAALRIVRRLDGHALAIEVVAIFLWQNPDITYQDYLIRLEEDGLEALEGAGSDELVQLSRHAEKMIGTLLEPTLASLSPEELSIVELASLLPPDNVASSWLRALVGREFSELAGEARPGHPNPWRRLMRRLTGLRIFTPNDLGLHASKDQEVTFRMHRLIQDVVARRMGELRAKRKRKVQLFVRDQAKSLWKRWAQQESRWELSPLMDYAYVCMNAKDPFGAWVASQLTEPMLQLGRFVEARALLQQAVVIREVESGPNHPSLGTSYSNLGLIERALGELESARELLQRAIAIWEDDDNAAPRTLAGGYSNLSTVQRALGDYDSAGKLARRAIELWESADEPDYRSLATGYANLAKVEGYLTNLESARELYKKSIAIKKKLYEPNHPSLASSYSDLAAVERSLSNYTSARELSEKAIVINEAAFEPTHPSLANSYAALATIERDLANFESVRKLWNQVIVIREEAYEPDHRILATSYAGLASVERDLANFAVSRELHQRALAIRVKAHQADHPILASSYASLASLEQDLANYPAARELHERALAIRVEALGPDHSALASSYSALGSLEKTLAKFTVARELYDRAFEIRSKSCEPDDLILAGSYSSMASLEQDLANYAEARKLHERALAIRKNAFEPDHPSLASSYAGLASLEGTLGNQAKSLELHQWALGIREKVFQSDHPVIASSYSALATLEWDKGNRKASQDLHRRALAIREKVFEPGHPVLANSYNSLASTERGMGNLAEARELYDRALEIRKKVFEPDHPLIASTYVGQSSVERSEGNWERACGLLSEALSIDESCYASDHPSIARDCSVLALVHKKLGQLNKATESMRRAWKIRMNKYGPLDKRTKECQSWLLEHDPEFEQ